jgi:hypothetical protein
MTMDEYIERKKLEEAFDNADPDVCESDLDGHSDWGFGRENVRDVIRGVPAADVAPVVHGRWAHLGGDEWCCSACGFVITTEGSWDKPTKKYCEDCGARMDGDSDELD